MSRNEINATKAMETLILNIHSAGERARPALEAVNHDVTLLTHERVVEIVTKEVPHSILTRSRPLSFPDAKKGERATVQDLVNTGFYRQSWQATFPTPLVGEVGTNAAYAQVLETGTADGKIPAFGVAARAARDMEPTLKSKLLDANRKIFGG